jgi:hypothetical protein
MADQLSWSAVGEWLAGFAPEGPLRTAVLLVYGLCAAVAPFIYKYYFGVLAQGMQPEESLERQDYDRLRASLAGGNLAARLYAKWLTAFLDGVERFFGDAGMADKTLFPHAFGVKKPAPLWTAPAFDRCLLLALIYPIVTIFFIWAISGRVGPAEAALGLNPRVPGWSRGLAAAAIGFSIFAYWRGNRARGWKSYVWIAVTGVCAGVAAAAAFGFVAAAAGCAVLFAVSFAFDAPGAFAVVGAVAVTVAVAVVGAVAVFAAGAAAGAVAAAAALAGVVGVGVLTLAIGRHRLGVFLSLFLPQ